MTAQPHSIAAFTVVLFARSPFSKNAARNVQSIKVVVDRRVGQVAHEVDLPVEDRLQLLEADDERAVEARVLVQRRRHVDRVALARRLQQVAQAAVERHADLVRHAEREHRQVGLLEPLRVQDACPGRTAPGRPGATGCKLTRTARRCRSRPARPPASSRCSIGGPVEGVQEQLELPLVRLAQASSVGRVRGGELRHLERQQRHPVVAELDGADSDDRHLEVLGKNRVELGDPACPRVQVVPGDTVNHQV